MYGLTSRNYTSLVLALVLTLVSGFATSTARAGKSNGRPAAQRERPRLVVPDRLHASTTKPRSPAIVTADQAMKIIRGGQRVLLPAEAGASQMLVDALVRRAEGLKGKRPVEVLHTASHLEQPTHGQADPSKLKVNALFINGGLRQYVGKLKITPAYLSEIPKLLKTTLKPSVVFIRVSPPDKRGFVSMGPSADVVADLLADPKVRVIAEINPNVPRTRGASRLHVSHIDYLVPSSAPMPVLTFPGNDPVAQAIGRNVAAQIPNGATLQLGIGELQEAVAGNLATRGKAINDKGGKFRVKVWTELASNGIKTLADAGLISKGRDTIRLGFGIGDKAFYDFLDTDKRVKLMSTGTINDPMIAGAQRKLTAINSGVQVDLYGQVCSEMVPRVGADGKVTPTPYSGVGGQVDFFRAVQRSKGGIGFLTLRSTAKNGTLSTISLDMPPGLVVTTNRYDVDRIVTEFGVAELRGKDVATRAQALIRVAHPKFRSQLAQQGLERFGGDPKSWDAAARVSDADRKLAAQLEPPPAATAAK
jgi:4-hydroxybutyrate CoA-transferase